MQKRQEGGLLMEQPKVVIERCLEYESNNNITHRFIPHIAQSIVEELDKENYEITARGKSFYDYYKLWAMFEDLFYAKGDDPYEIASTIGGIINQIIMTKELSNDFKTALIKQLYKTI